MRQTAPPARHDAVALQAGMLGSVLAIALLKALALATGLSGSPLVTGLWLLACALLGAWALAALVACLALSRRVFALTLALCGVFLACMV